MTDSLTLMPEHLIAKGWHRECYVDPQDTNRCIKVVVNGNGKETEREQAYYRLLQKRLTDWQAIPRFHGNIDTNLGQGAVFDLIRDADGQVSRTLAYYLENEARFFQYSSQLADAIRRLQSYQLQNNILTMSLKPKNLLLQKREDGNMAMFIIDNLGYAELLPLVCYFHSLGRTKIQRKWKRFGRLLKNQYPYLSDAFTSFR